MKRLVLAAAFLLATTLATASPASTLPPASHAYGLNSSFADELGGPSMGHQIGHLLLTSFKFRTGGGTSLTGAVAAATYSVEMRFKVSLTGSADSAYRLLDFKNGFSDLGLYAYSNGILQFYQGHFDNPQTGPGVIPANQFVDILITREGSSGVVNIYAGGTLAFTFIDSAGDAILDSPDSVHTKLGFFVDNNGEHGPGALDHVRVFDTVLKAAAASALAQGKLPPNVTQK